MQLAHIALLDEQIEALNSTIEMALSALSTDALPPLQPPADAAVSSAAPLTVLVPTTFTRAVEFLNTIPGHI